MISIFPGRYWKETTTLLLFTMARHGDTSFYWSYAKICWYGAEGYKTWYDWSHCRTLQVFFWTLVVLFKCMLMMLGDYGVERHNILVISWTPFYWWERPREKHWSAPSNWKKTLSHNVVSNTPCLSGIRTHNVCDDRYLLHR
jgi:hypothetical protein